MSSGEPAYVSVNIAMVHELTENTSKKMLQNITGSILSEMAHTSYSASSRQVLHEVSRRGDNTSVGVVQQECVHGETNRRIQCKCCQLTFYPTILESIYRDKSIESLQYTLNHLGSLQEIISTLELGQ